MTGQARRRPTSGSPSLSDTSATLIFASTLSSTPMPSRSVSPAAIVHHSPAIPRLARARHSIAHVDMSLDDMAQLRFQQESRSRSRARPGRGVPIVPVGGVSRKGTFDAHSGRNAADPVSVKAVPVAALNRASTETERIPTEADRITEAVKANDDETPYPRDERGEEMSSHARVWKVYMDQAEKADSAMIDGWNRSIDVLLVFAGLFSGVLTTFIIQAYSLLIPDSSVLTNALLSDLILLQQGQAIGGALAQQQAQAISFTPNGQARWVNGLWFASLACSLSSALVSMLAKQWLQAYIPHVSGSPRDRARLRQARLMGLQAWHVPAIVDAMPVVLHISLLLFFAGLVVLLWPLDLGVTAATLIIVAAAYTFYGVAMTLPLWYPDCPYHTPIVTHMRMLQPKLPSKLSEMAFNKSDKYSHSWPDFEKGPTTSDPQPHSTLEDELDAQALCWLITNCTDPQVNAIALQAIAGLPRDFSAVQLLKDAAQTLIEDGFQSCFQKDPNVDVQWHVADVDGAEVFCRAWMRLAYDTGEQWPLDIVEPLWALQDMEAQTHAAVTASCAVALSSFDSIASQWELLAYLAKFVMADIHLDVSAQCLLLDSISECAVRWEMPAAVIDETAIRAVPSLLRLLDMTRDIPSVSQVRSATALALYLFVCGTAGWRQRIRGTEDQRRAQYSRLILPSLAHIVASPLKFGVDEDLLDIVAKELAYLSSRVIAQSTQFPLNLRDLARRTLSDVLVGGKLTVGCVPDQVLANVLQLLFPLKDIVTRRRRHFVASLLTLLNSSTERSIIGWTVRLLEDLLTGCSVHCCHTFLVENGIAAVLRAVKAGQADSDRLQIDSLRTLCTFVHSVTIVTHSTSEDSLGEICQDDLLDPIFKSDFFTTLCSVVGSRRTWLFEVSANWTPALLLLCRLRPKEPVWESVIQTFSDFTEGNEREEGYFESVRDLEEMRRVITLATIPTQV